MTDLLTRLRALADLGDEDNAVHVPNPYMDALREAADALENRGSYNESEAKRAYDFEHALGHCQAERDALKAKLAAVKERHAKVLTQRRRMKAELVEAFEDAWTARNHSKDLINRAEKAEAEAAVLREALNDIAFWRCGCGATWASDKAKQALSQPGTGAALLERVKKLEAVAQAARSVLSEEGVDESLCAYNMGCELILRLQALDAERAPSSDQLTAKSNGKEGT